MQKNRKILSVVSEKTALPTNQPTNQLLQHRSYKTSLTPVQKTNQLSYQVFNAINCVWTFLRILIIELIFSCFY